MPGNILYQQELISEEINEVISYKPHWIVRKGNAVFLFILLFLLALTWLIKYPDIITASARIVAVNPPKLISSRAEGKLLKLFVQNEQQVHKGHHLAVIESTSDYDEVMKLQTWVDEILQGTKNNSYDVLNMNLSPAFYNLGELQTDYQTFQNDLMEAKQTLTNGFYEKKRNGLMKDLKYLHDLKANTYQQQRLLEEDQQLQKKEYDAYEKLEKEKVIAPLELNQYKSKLIGKDQSLKTISAELTNADVNIHGKEKELLDLQKTIFDQQQKFHSALLELKSQIEKWIQQYVLVASEDGRVLFGSTLNENQLVKNGEGLFFLAPKHVEYYSELKASQKGLGKIKVGQPVMVRVESFPSNEFGYLSGKVRYISDIPNRSDSFIIKVDLPKGLHTNYDKDILFRNDLAGQADIVTDDRKLFDRLIGQLNKLLNR